MIFSSEEPVDNPSRKKAKRKINRPPFRGIKKGAYDDFVIIRHGYQPPCLYPATPRKMETELMINARITSTSTSQYAGGDQTNRYYEAPEEIDKSAHADPNVYDIPKYHENTATQYAIRRSRYKVLRKLTKKLSRTASNRTIARKHMTPNQLAMDTRATIFPSSSSGEDIEERRRSNKVKPQRSSAGRSFRGDQSRPSDVMDQLRPSDVMENKERIGSNIGMKQQEPFTANVSGEVRNQGTSAGNVHQLANLFDAKAVTSRGVSKPDDNVEYGSFSNQVASSPVSVLNNVNRHQPSDAANAVQADNDDRDNVASTASQLMSTRSQMQSPHFEYKADNDDRDNVASTASQFMSTRSQRPSLHFEYEANNDDRDNIASTASQFMSTRSQMKSPHFEYEANNDDRDNVASTASQFMSTRSQMQSPHFDYVGTSHQGNKSRYSGGMNPIEEVYGGERGRSPKKNMDNGNDGERLQNDMHLSRFEPAEDSEEDESELQKNNAYYGKYKGNTPKYNDHEDDRQPSNQSVYASVMSRSHKLESDEKKDDTKTASQFIAQKINYFNQKYSRYNNGPIHTDIRSNDASSAGGGSRKRQNNRGLSLNSSPLCSESSDKVACRYNVLTTCSSEQNAYARRERIAVLLILYIIALLVVWWVFSGSSLKEMPKQKANQGFDRQTDDHLLHHNLEKGVQVEYKKVKRNRVLHYIRKEEKPEEDTKVDEEEEGDEEQEEGGDEEEEKEEREEDEEGLEDNEEDDDDGNVQVEDEDEQ